MWTTGGIPSPAHQLTRQEIGGQETVDVTHTSQSEVDGWDTESAGPHLLASSHLPFLPKPDAPYRPNVHPSASTLVSFHSSAALCYAVFST